MACVINALSTGAGGLVSSGDTSGVLQFQNNSNASVTLDTSGNLGIGTTSPTSGKLVISGTSVTTSQGIRLVGDTADARFICESATLGAGILGTFSNHSQLFYTNSTERMRIDSSGKVFIGTTSFTGLLNMTQTAGDWAIVENSTYAGTQYFNSFRYNSTQIGTITGNNTATAYNTSSDYRLKENIAPMTGALAKVAQLKPVTYKWKSTGEESQGFIAHELQEVVPDCVTGDKDAVDADGNPVYQGIDTSFLVATLTAALQELKAINDQQAETINALTARIVALEQA